MTKENIDLLIKDLIVLCGNFPKNDVQSIVSKIETINLDMSENTIEGLLVYCHIKLSSLSYRKIDTKNLTNQFKTVSNLFLYEHFKKVNKVN